MGVTRKGGAVRVLVALVTMGVLVGCRREVDRVALTGEIPIDIGEVATLYIDVDGRYWIGGAGGVAIVDSAGRVSPGVATRGTEPPRVVGSTGGALHIVHLDSLIAVDRDTHERSGARGGFERVPIVSDPRGRFVAQGARSGAVLAFDPRSIEPLWGWGARGEVTTAMALSPEADVVWQAIGDEDPRILRRDVQTGRIIARHEVAEPTRALVTTRNGDLLILSGEGTRLVLVRARPVAEELRTIWSTGIKLEGNGSPRVLHHRNARVVAVFRAGDAAGLDLLDVEAGTSVGSIGPGALDAQVSADGSLHVLFPDRIGRYRADDQ